MAPEVPDWRRFKAPHGVETLNEEHAATLVPERDLRGHKGTFGTLLCVCGSLDYLGASLLVGYAAVRAGAGLVSVAVPASLQPIVAGRVMEATTMGLPETASGDLDATAALAAIHGRSDADALLVGSGMRPGDATRDLTLGIVREAGIPAVLDAEALNSLARTPDWWAKRKRTLILTPHPGEFGRLEDKPVADDDAERVERAGAAATRWGTVVVLKGAHTVVAEPDGGVAMAGFENPALATGGTGDVLAGTIASLLAQGMAPFDAACLGVFLHGVAGEHVRERVGDAGLLAGELPAEVARVRRHLAGLKVRVSTPNRRLGFNPRATDG